MPRSQDLDIIAPDDPIVDVSTKPVKSPKKKVVKKTVADYQQTNPNQQFRDKISEIMGHTKSPLSSFIAHPKVFSFEEKNDGEEILLLIRSHWFTNVRWLVVALVLAIFPIFIPVFSVLGGHLPNYRFVFVLFWYLLTFIYAFQKFLYWYFNVLIITDERIIDIDFNNLLIKRFSEAKINMIQDVTSQVAGLFPTMFNYGHIFVQTAGEVPEIEFENVPNPEKVVKVLEQLRQEEELESLQGRIR